MYKSKKRKIFEFLLQTKWIKKKLLKSLLTYCVFTRDSTDMVDVKKKKYIIVMYKCIDCGKEFRYKSKLLEHQKQK